MDASIRSYMDTLRHPPTRLRLVSDSPRDPTSSFGVTPPPNYDRPLNELVHTLLPWFGAVYTLDRLNATVIPDPPRACLGGRVPLLGDDSEDEDDSENNLAGGSPPAQLSLDDMRKLRTLTAKLDGDKEVLNLFKRTCWKLSPGSKSVRDKPPEPLLTDANTSSGQNGRLIVTHVRAEALEAGLSDSSIERLDDVSLIWVAQPTSIELF